MMKRTIRVELRFAVCIITVSAKGVIIKAPPVLKCWIDTQYSKFYTYYEKRMDLIKTEVL